jgi:hypothetical protein
MPANVTKTRREIWKTIKIGNAASKGQYISLLQLLRRCNATQNCNRKLGHNPKGKRLHPSDFDIPTLRTKTIFPSRVTPTPLTHFTSPISNTTLLQYIPHLRSDYGHTIACIRFHTPQSLDLLCTKYTTATPSKSFSLLLYVVYNLGPTWEERMGKGVLALNLNLTSIRALNCVELR